MKTAIALAALLFVVCVQADISPAYLKKMVKYIDACYEKNGAKREDVLRLFRENKIAQTRELLCTVDCYFAEAGYIKDGKVDWEVARAATAEKYSDAESLKKAMKVLETCKQKVNIDGKKDCERSVEVLKCTMPEAKKIGLVSTIASFPKDA